MAVDTKVNDSRLTEDGLMVKRRRECQKCSFRFSTYEQIEILNLSVIKRHGDKEPYSREKLEAGEIGYIVTGFKEVAQARVGDTVTRSSDRASALPGYKQVKPMVFAGFFPETGEGAGETSFGLEVTIVTTAKNNEEGFQLLKKFGFPFATEEVTARKAAK